MRGCDEEAVHVLPVTTLRPLRNIVLTPLILKQFIMLPKDSQEESPLEEVPRREADPGLPNLTHFRFEGLRGLWHSRRPVPKRSGFALRPLALPGSGGLAISGTRGLRVVDVSPTELVLWSLTMPDCFALSRVLPPSKPVPKLVGHSVGLRLN